MSNSPYDDQYYEKIYGGEGLTPLSSHWWSVRLYVATALREMSRLRGKRVLEVGCGQGFILGQLARKYEAYGLDLSEYAVEQCRRFAPSAQCFIADVEKGLPPEVMAVEFDLIVARYVFEHLHDPLASMKTLTQRLRPGGEIFFSVPNTNSIGAKLKGDTWYALTDPTHHSLLSPPQWRAVVQDAGLELVTIFGDGYWDLPYFKSVPKWLQAPFFLAPTALACLTGMPILPGWMGENLLVVARRP
jgi:SAM-dependent methyltransferase